MSDEPDLTCPTCVKPMEILTIEEGGIPSNLLRVCLFCATLAWNNEDRPPVRLLANRSERFFAQCTTSDQFFPKSQRIPFSNSLFCVRLAKTLSPWPMFM